MRAFIVALMIGTLVTVVGYAQDKTEKSCCSSEKSETAINKDCDVSNDVSVLSNEKDNLIVSNQGDDKDKKIDKKMQNIDRNVKKDKSKKNSSEDGCCSPDKKKSEKTKTSDKS